MFRQRIELVRSSSIFGHTDDKVFREIASYCIVITTRSKGYDRQYIEIIGFYDPDTDPIRLEVHEQRALHWLNLGAEPSGLITCFLERFGTLGRMERLRNGEKIQTLLAENPTNRLWTDYQNFPQL
jgi:small subunit ribosomal protein S16